ncbi:MAG: hypothetical protein HY831_02785 [Candidatus Aenigmarchaeota archaeon]|nr:hypothetical protein [Candidatus Aenigmarchaeota archaeon]
MSDALTGFTWKLILALIVLAVVLGIFWVSDVQTNEAQLRTSSIGDNGVLKVESIQLKYVPEISGLKLTMKNVVHATGKNVELVPIIDIRQESWRPFFEDDDGLIDPQGTYDPSHLRTYIVPSDVKGYFIGIITDTSELNNPIHVSVWEESCIRSISTASALVSTADNEVLTFDKLVKRCGGSYLASYYVKVTQ